MTGIEELVEELHDLKNAMVYLEDEITTLTETLHMVRIRLFQIFVSDILCSEVFTVYCFSDRIR